jgi:folylpolyglutamate synthase/dihydropteroate synthase
LLPSVSAVVTTSTGVTGKLPLAADAIARVVRESGFAGPVIADSDPHGALATAMRLASERDVPVLITGSLYLVGRVRGRWYPDDDILRQRTPWPARH